MSKPALSLTISLLSVLTVAASTFAQAQASAPPPRHEQDVAPPETNLTFTENVTISKSLPRLTLHDPTRFPTESLEVGLGGGVGFNFLNGGSNTFLFSFIPSTGILNFSPVSRFFSNVGIGTNPSEKLHVLGVGGQTRLLLEETNSTVIGRNLLRLRTTAQPPSASRTAPAARSGASARSWPRTSSSSVRSERLGST